MESLTRSTFNIVISKYREGHGGGGSKETGGKSHISFSKCHKWVVDVSFRNLTSHRGDDINPILSSISAAADLQGEGRIKEAMDHLNTIHVKFQLQKACEFGDHFLMKMRYLRNGQMDIYGLLDWNLFNLALDIPVGKTIQFKFILRQSTGNILWQPGPDRIFKTWKTTKTITILEEWENSEAHIITKDEFTHKDEEVTLQLDVHSLKEIQQMANARDTWTTADATNSSTVKAQTTEILEIIALESAAPPEKPLTLTTSESITLSKDNKIAYVAEELTYPEKEPTISKMVAHNIVGDNRGLKSVESPESIEAEVSLIRERDPVLVPGLASISMLSTVESSSATEDRNNAMNGYAKGSKEPMAPEVTA